MGIRKILASTFLVLALCPLELAAQFDPQRTQYMYMPSAINPGALAIGDMLNVYGNYRLQWAGFSGQPKDVCVSAALPLTISGTKHGLGVSFTSETIGLFENQAFSLQYAYKFRLWRGTVGLGISLGAISQTFDVDGADFTGRNSGSASSGGSYDDYHSNESDPLFQSTTDQEGMAFDASFGAYYSDDKLNIGLSILHLNRPSFDFGDADKIDIARLLYFEAGYDWGLDDGQSDLHLKPSFLVRSDLQSSTQADFSLLAEYRKKFSGGLAYRWGDSFDFLVGAYVIDNLFLGYAYDLPYTGMVRSGGSHEFCLKYSFKLEMSKKNKYKSERIL